MDFILFLGMNDWDLKIVWHYLRFGLLAFDTLTPHSCQITMLYSFSQFYSDKRRCYLPHQV